MKMTSMEIGIGRAHRAAAALAQQPTAMHPTGKCNSNWEKEGEKENQGKREREKERKDEGGRDQEGRRKEKEREPEVKKDVTDWTVVTRNRPQRKMVQIFVRVNGSKATPMEKNLTDDKVEDVMRRIQNDEDAYVTMHGRVLIVMDARFKSRAGCVEEEDTRIKGA